MTKRIFASMAAALLAATALASCGSSDSSSSTGSTSSNSSTAASDESSSESAEVDGDAAAEAIANRTETAHLVLNWFTWSGSPAGVSRIQDAMNELTGPALNIEVEMQVTDYASRSQSLTLQLSGGEQLDILYSSGLGLTKAAQNDYVLDLEEDNLIQTYGQDIIDTMGWDNINTSRVNGVLYGTPTQHDLAQGRYAIAARTDILKEAEAFMDLTPDYDSDVWYVDGGLDDICTIIKALHDAEPNMNAYMSGIGTYWTSVDNLGGNVYGVLENWGKDTTEVVNYFETDTYKDMVNRMYDLNQYGCISPDAMTDTTANTAQVQAGTLISYVSNVKPGSRIQETTNCGTEMTMIQGGPDYTNSTQIGGFCWMIGYNTADPVAAMQYLNFMYESAEWNNLFMWGVDGVDNVEADDGTVTFTESSDYTHSMQWLAPAEFKAHVQTGNPANLWEMYDDFNKNATISDASGFTFDTANVATQYTAVDNVYSQYQKAIEYGFSDPETSIDEMNNAMMTAGLQDIIDEKQAQLDAWLDLKNN